MHTIPKQAQRVLFVFAWLLLISSILGVAGLFLPWVAYDSNGSPEQVGPITVISGILLVLLMVVALFGIAIFLIFRLNASNRTHQIPVFSLLLTWSGLLIVANLCSIFLMYAFLTFDDAGVVTNYHNTIGALCMVISILLAACADIAMRITRRFFNDPLWSAGNPSSS